MIKLVYACIYSHTFVSFNMTAIPGECKSHMLARSCHLSIQIFFSRLKWAHFVFASPHGAHPGRTVILKKPDLGCCAL